MVRLLNAGVLLPHAHNLDAESVRAGLFLVVNRQKSRCGGIPQPQVPLVSRQLRCMAFPVVPDLRAHDHLVLLDLAVGVRRRRIKTVG